MLTSKHLQIEALAMHTVIVVAIGLGLLGLCLLVGRFVGSGSDALGLAALAFVPLWLVGAAINMWLGVSRAGYSVADEAPIFLLVFGIPTAIALVLRWQLGS